MLALFFFFNDTATTEIYTLSLHDALPISLDDPDGRRFDPPRAIDDRVQDHATLNARLLQELGVDRGWGRKRSEEHTSELQSRLHLVCRLLLEKKKGLERLAGMTDMYKLLGPHCRPPPMSSAPRC